MNSSAWLRIGAVWWGTMAAMAGNLLPNPAFTEGDQAPTGWRLVGCAGEWRAQAGTNRVLTVTGTGRNSGYWRTPNLALQPGGLYALRFRARRAPESAGGSVIAGTSRVNRDFQVSGQWAEYHFFFRQPDDGGSDYVRLGQWHVTGGIEFARVALTPARASSGGAALPPGGRPPFSLGEAETVSGERYRFSPGYGWPGANFHRPLHYCTAGFNTDRWTFSAGAEVVYRFALPAVNQTGARARVNLNYHTRGRLLVEASRDGREWTEVATFDGAHRSGPGELPKRLFPAREIFLRLRAPDPDTSLQVNQCDYEARLEGVKGQNLAGSTAWVAIEENDPALAVEGVLLNPPSGTGRIQWAVVVSNRTDRPLRGRGFLHGPGVRRGTVASREDEVRLPPHEVVLCRSTLQATRAGEHELRYTLLADSGKTLLNLRGSATISFLDDPRAGHPLAGANDCALWWCESGWKISRTRGPVTGKTPRPIALQAAGGETEAAQLILRPLVATELRAVTHSDFTRADGGTAPLELRFYEVAYVEVTTPTDATCTRGWYPDPLPPLQLPLKLRAGLNQPLWLSCYVPRGTPAGDYAATVTLKLRRARGGETLTVPLTVHVYDFALPRETHLRSALGLGAGNINRYHKLTRPEDREAVFAKYLENFAEHRISPYSFFDYAPIKVSFVGEGTNRHARVDFTAFDRWAERWLDGARSARAPGPQEKASPSVGRVPQPGASTPAGQASQPGAARSADVSPDRRGSPFNSFRLPLHGMGGGTFHSRHLGTLEGFQEGTPEHARLFRDYLRQIEAHLRAKGWLDQAFTYWFDEPAPKDYAFVVAGQERIKAAAPGLKRMLTEQPEPELIGHVDIWCGLTPHWTPKKVAARRAAGEEVWWYICTGPKAPYVTEFIDHPGLELRLWPWQSWQYGVNGILIWATIYWTSPLAYPHSLQNPWRDPMSWVSGYGRPVGTRSPWGNGDGRFLYPPRRDPNTATTPCLDGPINSIRWENLRDGMEDYEYFWLLRQAITRAEKSRTPAAVLTEARALLKVPPEISQSLTRFTTDPRVLLAHRDRLARMIERLRRATKTGG
jgi:hypothetical protein